MASHLASDLWHYWFRSDWQCCLLARCSHQTHVWKYKAGRRSCSLAVHSKWTEGKDNKVTIQIKNKAFCRQGRTSVPDVSPVESQWPWASCPWPWCLLSLVRSVFLPRLPLADELVWWAASRLLAALPGSSTPRLHGWTSSHYCQLQHVQKQRAIITFKSTDISMDRSYLFLVWIWDTVN